MKIDEGLQDPKFIMEIEHCVSYLELPSKIKFAIAAVNFEKATFDFTFVGDYIPQTLVNRSCIVCALYEGPL